MALTLSGDDGVAGVNGSATTPALQGTDTNTGISFGTDTVNVVTGGSTRTTVDSSGRLLVGTSSNFVRGDLQVVAGGGGEITIARNDDSVVAGNDIGHFYFASNDSGTGVTCAQIECYAEHDHTASSASTNLRFNTTAQGATTTTERMRIQANGRNRCFGADEVHESYTGSAAGTSISIYSGGYNRSTINSGGTISYYVWSNGNVQNTNNSYTGISDVKLKENIVDASSQWDDLKALQVRNYNFKEGQTHTQIGLIAQEVELVSPGLVTESPDRETVQIPLLDKNGDPVLDENGDPTYTTEERETGTVTKSVNYSVLYMKSVKALQEAMERIEQLETRVAQLEGGAS
jgi:hypothetical protein